MKEKVFLAILAAVFFALSGCNQANGDPDTDVDKTALVKAITDANALIDATTVGTAPGNVPQAANTAYALAIGTAEDVNDNASATQSGVDSAVAALAQATTAFKAAIVKQSFTSMKFPYGYVFDCDRNYDLSAKIFSAESLRPPIDEVLGGFVTELRTDTGSYIVPVITTSSDNDTIINVALDLYNEDGDKIRRIVENGAFSYIGSDQVIFVSEQNDYGYLFSRTRITTTSVSYPFTSVAVTKKSQLW